MMGAPSPCPEMPSRRYSTCTVSRYSLDDMVVVQVWRSIKRLMRDLDRGRLLRDLRRRRRTLQTERPRQRRQSSNNRVDSLFDSPYRNQKLRPGHVVEPADLHAGMAVRGVVNELAVAKIHAGMGNLGDTRAKEQQVAGLQSLRSTGITPVHAACRSASRGISIPRCRSSICVNPEQSKPKLLTPPHV